VPTVARTVLAPAPTLDEQRAAPTARDLQHCLVALVPPAPLRLVFAVRAAVAAINIARREVREDCPAVAALGVLLHDLRATYQLGARDGTEVCPAAIERVAVRESSVQRIPGAQAQDLPVEPQRDQLPVALDVADCVDPAATRVAPRFPRQVAEPLEVRVINDHEAMRIGGIFPGERDYSSDGHQINLRFGISLVNIPHN